MEFDFFLAQDIGTRSEQQDSAAVCPFDRANGTMLVIADGLGGHTGGARASHIVVKTFADAGESGRFKGSQDRYDQLGAALSSANAEIAQAARSLNKNETMGTTLVAAVAAWNSLGWISVGDSHLYLWRAGKLTKLNEDHSQAGQMIKSGRYKEDDPELDSYRSMLRSAIMGRDLTLIDRPIETKDLQRGDVLVLATDGLNVVDLPKVEEIVTRHAGKSSEVAANALLDAVRASEASSRDNATVIVARVVALDGEAKPASPEANKPSAGEVRVDVVTPSTIMTTPFLRTGRPTLSAAQSAAIARQPDPVGHSNAATRPMPFPDERAASSRFEPLDEPKHRRGSLWIALLLAVAVAATAVGIGIQRYWAQLL